MLPRRDVSIVAKKRRDYKLRVLARFSCSQFFSGRFTAFVLNSPDRFCCSCFCVHHFVILGFTHGVVVEGSWNCRRSIIVIGCAVMRLSQPCAAAFCLLRQWSTFEASCGRPQLVRLWPSKTFEGYVHQGAQTSTESVEKIVIRCFFFEYAGFRYALCPPCD